MFLKNQLLASSHHYCHQNSPYKRNKEVLTIKCLDDHLVRPDVSNLLELLLQNFVSRFQKLSFHFKLARILVFGQKLLTLSFDDLVGLSDYFAFSLVPESLRLLIIINEWQGWLDSRGSSNLALTDPSKQALM